MRRGNSDLIFEKGSNPKEPRAQAEFVLREIQNPMMKEVV
jgi:hypothetical protein